MILKKVSKTCLYFGIILINFLSYPVTTGEQMLETKATEYKRYLCYDDNNSYTSIYAYDGLNVFGRFRKMGTSTLFILDLGENNSHTSFYIGTDPSSFKKMLDLPDDIVLPCFTTFGSRGVSPTQTTTSCSATLTVNGVSQINLSLDSSSNEIEYTASSISLKKGDAIKITYSVVISSLQKTESNDYLYSDLVNSELMLNKFSQGENNVITAECDGIYDVTFYPFRCYDYSYTVDNYIKYNQSILFEEKASPAGEEEAKDYATYFNTTVGEICDVDDQGGVHTIINNLKNAWKKLSESKDCYPDETHKLWLDLSSKAQEILTSAPGTITDETSAIYIFAYKYDYVYEKYWSNLVEYGGDFAGRYVSDDRKTKLTSVEFYLFDSASGKITPILIILITILFSAFTIVGYFFIKRKREE